jgi:hypothetical protein
MPSLRLLAALLAVPFAALAQTPEPLTAAEIMARVAANQDRAEVERAHYVYVQHARVSSRKGKTIQCEEITDMRVAPQPDSSQRALIALDGKLLVKKQYTHYSELPKKKDDEDVMDRDLVENLRKNLTDEKSKDGLHAGLFPLTTKAQPNYLFELKGREHRNGRDTFHITFTPKDKDEFLWRGDAWIDTEAFQPVVVQTAMSRNIPFAVRMLLGTSVPGLGFTVTYAPQPDGTWFPASFGSEFKINAVFLYHRTILIAAENRDFQKTHVDAHIVPDSVADAPQP